LTESARRRPDHPAVEAAGRHLTYAELDHAATLAAQQLAALGVGGGDRVATTLRPGLAFADLLHAAPRLGAVLVPLDPGDPATVDARLTVGEALAGRGADVELRFEHDPNAVHTVIHTAGTTGRPKAVELTYGNHHASATASARNLGVEPGDRWLCCLPLHHVGGLSILLRSAIYGTTAVLHDGFNARAVEQELESGSVTLISLVPTMLARLRDAGLREAPALRAALLGGGPAPSDLVEWAVNTGLPVHLTYGMTETASQVATAAPGETAAQPLPGAEVRIARSEGGGPEGGPPDEGEILVRGPMVAPGALAQDGWLHTGDLGQLDQDGRLHVEGRVKDLIVTGGENVSPAEVEGALVAHPAVVDAGVIGLPDPEWGEAVTAFVVLTAEASADELIAWCRQRLAPFKVPKRIERIGELPRGAQGKLLRDRLADGPE
jgi:o-succinylbenzoate---CoA ligase